MSKKTKGWLIAALCLIAAGGVFIAVGQGLGAASADETRTGIGIIDGFHINVGSPVRLGWGSGGNSGSEKQEIITFTAEETASIEELDVEWNAGKLEFEEWNKTYIEAEVKYTDYSLKPSFTIKNGRLTVETEGVRQISINFGSVIDVISCVIRVPAGFSVKKAKVELNAGILELTEGLRTAGKLDLCVNAGEMDVEGITALENCRIDVNAGKLDVESVVSKQETRIGVNAGKADVEGTFEGDVDAEVNAGALNFQNSVRASDTSVDVTVSAGSASVNGHRCSGMDSSYVDTDAARPHAFTAHVSAGALTAEYAK